MTGKNHLMVGVMVYLLALPFFTSLSIAGEFRSWLDMRDSGVVKQSLDYTCGVASMATLLSYYFDRPTTEDDLLALLEKNAQQWSLPVDWRDTGVSFSILAQIAQHFDLRAIGVAVDIAALGKLTVPAIAYMEFEGFSHFTVIRGVNVNGRVQLADSSWGNRALSKVEFSSLWAKGEAGKGKLLLLRSKPGSISTELESYFGAVSVGPKLQPSAAHQFRWH